MTDPHSLTIDSRSIEQTFAIGKAIGQCCAAGDVLGLDGQLGAGKTQLVRGLAEGLGIDPRQVSSPTFVLVQEYEPAAMDPGHPVLVHIDAYRLRNADDLASIGWHDEGAELRDGAVVAIEWAELIRPMLGPDLLQIEIAHQADGREVRLTGHGSWRERMQGLAEHVREHM